jgi:hypothetical protein
VAQQQAHHLVVHVVPIPGFAQAPAVDDVADQEQFLGFEGGEKMRQEVAAAAARSEMRIGNEDGPVGGLMRGGERVHLSRRLTMSHWSGSQAHTSRRRAVSVNFT